MLTIPPSQPRSGLPHLAPGREAVRRRLRLLVRVLVWGALPAAAILAAVVAWQAWTGARISAENRLRETAQTAAQTLDAKLSAYEAAARMLAYAPQLQPGGNPMSLYAQARAAGMAIGGWVVIIDMTDPNQPQLLNTRTTPAPRSQPETIAGRAGITENGRATVSDLFTPPNGGAPSVMLAVPVPQLAPGPRLARPRLTVDFVVEVSTLAPLLGRQALDRGRYLVLLDGHHDVLARSSGPQSDVGRHVARLDQVVLVGVEGVARGRNMAGMPTMFAWRRLAMAPNWLVVAVAPLDSVAAVTGAPLRGVLIAGGAVLLMLVLVLVAMWRGRVHDRAAFDDLDRVLANVPAAVFVDQIFRDGGRKRLFLSRGVSRLAGWSWDEMRREANMAVHHIDTADLPAYQAYRRMVQETGQGNVEVRLRGRDGSWRTLRSEESCFERSADGSMLVAGCVIDVTDAAAAKAQMRQMEKLALLGEVATGIAHEINQPLSAIAMAAENGARSVAAEPPRLRRAGEKFDLIAAQAQRISAVITHIRTFGRTGGGDVGPVDVARVITDMMSLLAGRLRQDRVVPHIEVPEGLPKVHGAAVMLEQVVMNLMVNAADAYRAHPEIEPRPLLVRAAPDGADSLRIEVADQAGGIPPEMLDRIFDPFFTTKAPGEGTGLGLSISMATIASMGGRLAARNQDGGALFEITLPILAAPDTPEPAAGCFAPPGPV